MPQLVPVDHDPFGGAVAGASGPQLVPVDHDPFAGGPAAAAGAPADSARAWARDITTIGPDQRPSLYGTPISKTGDGYLDTADQYYRDAVHHMGESGRALMDATDPTKPGSPMKAVGAVAGLAHGAASYLAAPLTAAINPAWEYVTGIPGEAAVGAVMPAEGAVAEGVSVLDRAGQAVESVGRLATVPGGNPLSLPGTLARRGPVDMGELAADIYRAPPEVPPAASPAAAEGPPAAAVATPREGLSVRLLPPDAPHAAPMMPRASVGAAGASTDPLAGYSPQAIEKARQVLEENGLDNPHTLEQVLEEHSAHHTFGEMSPGLESKMGGIAAADTAGARNTIIQTLQQRSREAPERMGAALDRAFGEGQNRAELQRDIEAERNKTASPFWDSFTKTSVSPTPEIRALMPRLEAAGSLKAANKAMAEEGLPSSRGFEIRAYDKHGDPVTETERVPTAAAWQYVKENLDAKIQESLAAPGGANAARRYTQLKDAVVKALDNHPDTDVAGKWKAGRQAWQEPTELLEAQNLGRRLLTNHIDREDVPYLTAGWSPARMEHLQIGLRNYLEGLERSNRNPNRVSNKLMDAVLSPGNQEKIRAVLGDEKADELIGAIGHEDSMHGAPGRVFGNSATSGRETAKREWMPAPGMLDDLSPGKMVGHVVSAFHDPVTAAAKIGGKVGIGRFGAAQAAKREAEMAALRDEMARIFTTQGEEKKAIARALIGAEEPPPAGWSTPSPSKPSPGPAPAAPTPAAAAKARRDARARQARQPVSMDEFEAQQHRPNVASPTPAAAQGASPAEGGPNVEALKQDSDVRLAQRLGVTAHVQHLAMAGKSAADIAVAIGNRLAPDQVVNVMARLGYADANAAPALFSIRPTLKQLMDDKRPAKEIREELARGGHMEDDPADYQP